MSEIALLLVNYEMVRMKGVEPIRREALDPKSSVSANSTTSAYFGRDYRN